MHGGYETAEVRHVRRIGGGRGLHGGPGKRVDGVFPGRPQSFRHQRRPVDDCSPGQGGMAQDGGTRGGTFHGEIDHCRESQGWTTACTSIVCSNVTGRIKEMIAQSRRTRVGSLSIVDEPQVARTCIFGRMSCCLSLALRLFCFVLFPFRLFRFH